MSSTSEDVGSTPSETGGIDDDHSQEVTEQDTEKKTGAEEVDDSQKEEPEVEKKEPEPEAINTENLGLPPSWNFDGPRQSRELTTSVQFGTFLNVTEEEADRPFE